MNVIDLYHYNCFFIEVNIKWKKSMTQNKSYYKSAVP